MVGNSQHRKQQARKRTLELTHPRKRKDYFQDLAKLNEDGHSLAEYCQGLGLEDDDDAGIYCSPSLSQWDTIVNTGHCPPSVTYILLFDLVK